MDKSIAIFAVTALLVFAVGFLLPLEQPPEIVQPIDFNHLAHTKKTTCWECHFLCEKNRDEDGEIDCEDCDEVEDGPFCAEHLRCPDHRLPGLPQTKECIRCHEDDLLELTETPVGEGDPSSERKRGLLDYIGFDEYEDPVILGEIPWKRVTSLPRSNVYFSHRTHALVGGVKCEECHGDVGSMETPPPSPQIVMTMTWCLDCHEAEPATEDCASCHR